ncbi:MAG: type II toxin-antitoxin system VapC family toxin [Deltaproteobacteria bacterium]|nr:type II toxin-antitoxin system VapC family toxin [Deltaproteobacteria bacterium]
MARLIDTHIWIWWLTGSNLLSLKERLALENEDEPLLLSSISLWEASLLHEMERIKLLPNAQAWVKMATSPDLVQVLDLSPEIVSEIFSKKMKTLHKDPADRIIVASARALKIPLHTHDKKIIQSGLVKIWKP